MKNTKLFAAFAIFFIVAIGVVLWPKKTVADHEEKGIQKCSPGHPEQCEAVTQVIPTAEKQITSAPCTQESLLKPISNDADLPQDVDRIRELFATYPPKLPFVETLEFTTKVGWLTGRLAYLGDYASHHKTSKHFISRSLTGTEDYFNEKVRRGDRFNVFRSDKEIEFHLVADLSRLKVWFYCYDVAEQKRTLLKTYPISAGKLNPSSPSCSLTPTGTYLLGKEIAVYKEGTIGTYQGSPKEMIGVFGVRWIPVAREIADCTGPAKGLGLHGVPWHKDEATGTLVEKREQIGKYASLGCLHFLSEDISELYAIIATKPTYLHIVRDFSLASLPGEET